MCCLVTKDVMMIWCKSYHNESLGKCFGALNEMVGMLYDPVVLTKLGIVYEMPLKAVRKYKGDIEDTVLLMLVHFKLDRQVSKILRASSRSCNISYNNPRVPLRASSECMHWCMCCSSPYLTEWCNPMNHWMVWALGALWGALWSSGGALGSL